MRHSAQDEDGAGVLLAVAVAVPLGAVVWAGLILLARWIYDNPEGVALIAAGVLLVAGSGIVAYALERMERDR